MKKETHAEAHRAWHRLIANWSEPGPKYCFRCGATNNPNATYCVGCGALLNY